MQTFNGKLLVEGGDILLVSGGIKVKVDGSAETFRAFANQYVSITGEQSGGTILHAAIATQPEAAGLDGSDDLQELTPIVESITRHLNQLQVPGVVSARPGYSMLVDGQLEQVIRVAVKPGVMPAGLPSSVDCFRVQQETASPLEILEPPIPLSAWTGALPETIPAKNYRPPANLELKPIEVKNITCHVGPDAGWITLKPFLEATTKSLTVAMYEFYAEHIIDTITSLGTETDAQLDMILQVSSNDKNIRDILEESWPDRVRLVAASVSGPKRLFNNSYHTKVAVRDSEAMWLSSGNWSPNSQPLLEPGDDPFVYRRGNREWHVIIEDKKIAELYEAFIRYDMDQSGAITAPESQQVFPDLLIPASMQMAEAGVAQPAMFEPRLFATGETSVKVQPLMSPDNYAGGVLKLIESAETSIYLQFSYINQPSLDIFDKVIKAISKKIKAGLDVKIIVGGSEKPDAINLLIARGWKPKYFRKQSSKLHNKGILIDGKIAGVGSNNWSNDGTQYNRDTTLIFYSRPIAKYYTEVFLFDWNNLSKPVIKSQPEVMPEIAPEGPTPLGKVRIPWQAWYDE